MPGKVSKSDVIAFRLGAHHLTERLDPDGLLDAAGRCGIQNSPPGSALLALHARVRDVTQDKVTEEIAGTKSLLQTWCMRGLPFFFPAADAPVFTTGVLPPTDEAKRHLVTGVERSVDRLGMSLTEAVERTDAEIHAVLSGRRLAIDELGADLAQRIARTLPKKQREIWQSDGPHAEGQSLGEGVVHFCVRILTLQGTLCFAPRTRNEAPFVLVDEWLDTPVTDTAPQLARSELLRRYLRSYGPSTRGHFAAWLGVKAGDVDPWWSLLEEELSQVDLGGRKAWILTEDLAALRSAPEPEGVRLLPPRDPYTQMRDRDTIVDEKYHREVWKTVGEPGAILTHGRISGTWRPRKSGRKLAVTVRTFASLPKRDQQALRDEAEQIAPLRGASTVDVGFDTY
ncbi:hypothetical protein DSC45_01720 [Streptomyces sp. YIM 130001]|uniref:winged helix DNA-binding domain-containing protein n=1 Tax=Streptomyces sp. YIM 130001 TaxID=2259644 RepID=UPI000E646FE5|nr:winged helix DNA-binding domain-containing protein [Streptomyces sp. YIM 130001]RII20820.1 hypothetical protein DSC45_01720 [Streptomyces sp. YIM 130001]